MGWRYWIVKRLKNLPKTSILPPNGLLCLPPNQYLFKKHLHRRFIYQNKLLQLFDQSIYLKIVSYINPNFPNIPIKVQNFQTLFENFVKIMSKLVISKTNISKTDLSYLLKRTLMYTFQKVTNFIFKVDWFTFTKTNSLELFDNFKPSQQHW